MGKVNGISNEPPIKYPTWEFEGVIYTMKQGYASTYLLDEYGVTPEQLKAAREGRVTVGMLVKAAASMMGTIDRAGRWRAAKIDPLELAASIQSEEEWKDLSMAVSEAMAKVPATTTPAPAPPQTEQTGPAPN